VAQRDEIGEHLDRLGDLQVVLFGGLRLHGLRIVLLGGLGLAALGILPVLPVLPVLAIGRGRLRLADLRLLALLDDVGEPDDALVRACLGELLAIRSDDVRTSAASSVPVTWLSTSSAPIALAKLPNSGGIFSPDSANGWWRSPRSSVASRDGITTSEETPSFCVDCPPGRKKRAVVILSAPSPGGSGVTVCTVPLPKVWSSPVMTAR
jgi:hypothetical protein